MNRLEGFQGCRIAVVGDVMLDEFVRGDVARISPEAPVPVVEVKERVAMPGGAANAAANIASLGGRVSLVGCVGDDRAGLAMRDLMEKAGVDTRGVVVDRSRETTVKTRIVARNQHVVRIDHETRGAFGPSIAEAIADAARTALAEVDVCVISDYGKGTITPELVRLIVERAGEKPIVVDPKRRDVAAYRGATVITPNVSELEIASGRRCATVEEIVEAARSLLPDLGGGAILVTRGAEGMSFVEPGKPVIHVPARSRPVFDVTGAGDTVVGTLALGLAAGLPIAVAIEVASAAAAIAVSKPGTATVTIDELRAELDLAGLRSASGA